MEPESSLFLADLMQQSKLARPSAQCITIFLRLKVHPNVPNANLPNLTDFPNPNVPGLISKDPDVRKSLIQILPICLLVSQEGF